jgi:hypothetical protein
MTERKLPGHATFLRPAVFISIGAPTNSRFRKGI